MFGPSMTPVTPMIQELIAPIISIRERMGVNSKEYKSIVTEISAVALGITIENVNNAQEHHLPFGGFDSTTKIRSALEDAVKVVKYIELMGPEQKFLTERLAPNKKTLDRMASSFVVSASVDYRTFYTEAEYYRCSHTKAELSNFLARYPDGTYAQNAKNRIETITTLEKQLATVTTIEECQNIFTSRQRDNVCDGLIDDKCFSLLKNKEKDCMKYLQTFSKHSKEVKAKLKTIRKWWVALGIVNAALLGCFLMPEIIALPIIVGIVELFIDACV
jgi:hypothetical protein